MKKAGLVLFFMVFIFRVDFVSAQTTTNFNLNKDSYWEDAINDNWDIIDSQMKTNQSGGLDTSAPLVITGDWDFGSGGIEIENGTTVPGSCTAGQLFLDTNATTGQQLYGCESGTFILQGGGGAGGWTPIATSDLEMGTFSIDCTNGCGFDSNNDNTNEFTINPNGSISGSGAAAMDIEGANIIYLDISDNIDSFIASANVSSGDTLILASGTYTISEDIDIAKSITIIGNNTIIAYTGATAINIFDITTNNVKLKDISIISTTTHPSGYHNSIAISGISGNIINGIVIDNVSLSMTGTARQRGIFLYDANADIINVRANIITSNDYAIAMDVQAGATTEAEFTVNIFNSLFSSKVTSGGAGDVVTAFNINETSSSVNITVNSYNTTFFASENAATSAVVRGVFVNSLGGGVASLNMYGGFIGGDIYDNIIRVGGVAIFNIYGVSLDSNDGIVGDVVRSGLFYGNGILVSGPSEETITAGAVISADACGSVKYITAASAVTTNTTNTFDSSDNQNQGCSMTVCNSGSNTITLDNNVEFKSEGGADVALTADDCIAVASTGTVWLQTSTLIAN